VEVAAAGWTRQVAHHDQINGKERHFALPDKLIERHSHAIPADAF